MKLKTGTTLPVHLRPRKATVIFLDHEKNGVTRVDIYTNGKVTVSGFMDEVEIQENELEGFA